MAVMRMKNALNVRVCVFLTRRYSEFYKTAGILCQIVSDYIYCSDQKMTESGIHGFAAKSEKNVKI